MTARSPSRLAPAIGILVAACASADHPSTTPLVVTLAVSPDAGQDPTQGAGDHVEVSVRAMPVPLMADGDLAEWGPSGASSRVAIAIDAGKVAIAADLRGAARSGVWLGVRFEPTEVPQIGDYDPVNGLLPLDCAKDARPTCRSLVEARDDMNIDVARRAVTVFRIDAHGISEHYEGGGEVPLHDVDPGKVHVHVDADRLRFEAELPLSVLPASAAPTLTGVDLAVELASHRPPTPWRDVSGYRSFELPAAVAFEPTPELRARAHELLVGAERRFVYWPGSGSARVYAYVGDPQSNLLYADTLHLQSSARELFTPIRRLGAVEIGRLMGDLGFAVLKDGKPLDVRTIEPSGSAERDGELHVFSSFVNGTSAGTVSSGWGVLAIAPDGKLREDIVDDSVDNIAVRAEPFNAPDFSSFGVERTFTDPTTGTSTVKTLVWRYDPRARRYVPRPGRRPAKPKNKR